MDHPEQGQLVEVRKRFFLVQDVRAHSPDPSKPVLHRVTLECLDDDRLGERTDLIWELEVHKQTWTEIGLPRPDGWDPQPRFQAFLNALRWSSPSLVEGPPLVSPFHAAIEEEPYQLEPVVRALSLPRVNLLIGDDVGLGKTVEAGLVLQELLGRQRARKVLILCPASLQRQWQEEMLEKFNLEFRIIDREAILQLRREYGVQLNPWTSFPRLITSLDFLKRESILEQFVASTDQAQTGRDWDILILDEAHNVAPSGQGFYVRDSDRTRLVKRIGPLFQHRLFLTATPHNGYTTSFTALLEMLDPLRFSRGPTVNPTQVRTIVIRRMKDAVVDAFGNPKFVKRQPVRSLKVPMPLDQGDPERKLFDLLREYTTLRMKRADKREMLPFRFTFTLLKKRLLSSPHAFSESLNVHLDNLTRPGRTVAPQPSPDAALARSLQNRSQDDWDDDEEKASCEKQAIEESARFFGEITPEEDQLLSQLASLAGHQAAKPDRKALVLRDWVETHLKTHGKWNGERLIIFTEYLDTLAYLKGFLESWVEKERILTLVGGMRPKDWEAIKKAFQASPAEHPVRILLATDAAAEGLNLQNHCRYLIHYEVPWNPNRMEQRNGRIDRHGQKREVSVWHFAYENHEDSRFLEIVATKVDQIRNDLGSVGEVIERQVEEAMLADRSGVERLLRQQEPLSLPEERRKRVQEELQAELNLKTRIAEIGAQIQDARLAMNLSPDNLRKALDEALKLANQDPSAGLQPVEEGDLAGKAWKIQRLPESWKECSSSYHDEKGRLLGLVFTFEDAKDRSDAVYVHLNHPLVQRAVGIFRTNLWPQVFQDGLRMQRASYRVLKGHLLREPVAVAYGRLVIMSTLGNVLHESLQVVGGTVEQERLTPMPKEALARLLGETFTHPPIPTQLGERIRLYWPLHSKSLEGMLQSLEREEGNRLRQRLKAKGQEESKVVQGLFKERISELEKRIKDSEAPQYRQQTLGFTPDLEALNQFDDDMKWLRQRLGALKEQAKTEPEAIRDQYEVKSVRVYPLALEYLLPEPLLRVDGHG